MSYLFVNMFSDDNNFKYVSLLKVSFYLIIYCLLTYLM